MTANLVAQRLKNAGFRVFIDTDEMHSGKFDKQLYSRIEKCKDFVLILCPEALDRCHDENDWVRNEILHAIKCKKNIIPLLFQGFEWPDKMPEGMQDLNMYQSLVVDDTPQQYNWAIDQLGTRYLKSKKKKKGNKALYFVTTVAVIALAVIAFLLYNKIANSSTGKTGPEKTAVNDTTTIVEQDGTGTNVHGKVAEKVSTAETGNQVTATKAVTGESTGNPAPAVAKETTKSPAPAVAKETTESPTQAVAKETTESQAPAVTKETTKSPVPAVAKETTESPTQPVAKETTKSPAPAVAKETTEKPAQAVAGESTETNTVDEKYLAGIKEMNAGNGTAAIELFEESGCAAALHKIGEIYENGCGTIEKNSMKAEEYFEKARESGYRP